MISESVIEEKLLLGYTWKDYTRCKRCGVYSWKSSHHDCPADIKATRERQPDVCELISGSYGYRLIKGWEYCSKDT